MARSSVDFAFSRLLSPSLAFSRAYRIEVAGATFRRWIGRWQMRKRKDGEGSRKRVSGGSAVVGGDPHPGGDDDGTLAIDENAVKGAALERFESRVRQLLAKSGLQPQDVENRVQEGCLRLLKTKRFVDLCRRGKSDEAAAYALTAAQHLAYKFPAHVAEEASLRSASERIWRRIFPGDRDPTRPERLAIRLEERAALDAAIDEAGGVRAPELREYLERHVVREEPQRQVLEDLGLTRGFVRHRIDKIRRLLEASPCFRKEP